MSLLEYSLFTMLPRYGLHILHITALFCIAYQLYKIRQGMQATQRLSPEARIPRAENNIPEAPDFLKERGDGKNL